MLRSIGKQSGESVESVVKKKARLRWEGFGERQEMWHVLIAFHIILTSVFIQTFSLFARPIDGTGGVMFSCCPSVCA